MTIRSFGQGFKDKRLWFISQRVDSIYKTRHKIKSRIKLKSKRKQESYVKKSVIAIVILYFRVTVHLKENV